MTERRRRQVVVLGFDAMSPRLVRTMMSRGRLPNFAACFGAGATAAVRTPPGVLVGGVWPSFWTGRWPSQHGFYCFRQLVSGTYRIRRVSPDDVVDSPFWMSLDEAGLRTCMLDVPLVPQTRPVRGIHVTDWGTHDRMLDPHAWPENVERELSESVGAHAVVGTCDAYGERRGWSDLVRDLGRGVEQRTELSLGLLGSDDWDCFATVYSESHCAGHQLWWAHDPSHPDYSRDAADPLEGVYEILDGALGRLLAAIDPHATVLLVLSHGIGQHHDAEHLLAEILARLDDAYGAPPAWLVARERVLCAIERRRAPKAHVRGVTYPDGSVASSRHFFRAPNNEYEGAVRVNLRGREPRGRVAPGEELDALLTWLERELLNLRDPESGRTLVRRVLRASTVYSGARLDALPDLFIDWERSAPITAAASDTVGVVRGEYTGTRSGDHRPGGFLVARGPGIEPGPIDGVAVVDLAPTIVELLGVDGGPFDGAPIRSLIEGHR
jgi:predicted AlkP superfamily phosphohydrolase/phosphomutase